MSFHSEYFVVDFDESRRIMHLAYARRIRLQTKHHVDQSFALFQTVCERYYSQGRFYLIIDISNLVIEPELTAVYAKNVKKILDKYILPRGVARYGHQITRLTIRRAYSDYLGENPQIFATRGEACAYIDEVINANRDELSVGDPTA